MIPHPSLHWNEILAAYADGEFEGRDDLVVLKQRVEDWLARHPEAAAELAAIRQLKQLWLQTTPAAPSEEAWERLHAQARQLQPATPRHGSWRRKLAASVAIAACVTLAVALGWLRWAGRTDLGPEVQPIPVATADEVEILNVDGADTHTLVVGLLPVQGPLQFAAPGDVSVTSVQPAARDNMMPDVHVQGPGRPMIWARLDTD